MGEAREGARDPDELGLGRLRGRCVTAVVGPVVVRAARRQPDGPGLEGFARERGHLRDVPLGRPLLRQRPLTHHEDPKRVVRHLRREVDDVGSPIEGGEVLGEGLPVPVDALGQRRARDVLDALHEIDQTTAVGDAHRREADPAASHHRRRHAVVAARRQLGVPGDLPVVVGVDVDEAGGDDRPGRVDDLSRAPRDVADGDDPSVGDGHVGPPPRPAAAIDDVAADDLGVVGHVVRGWARHRGDAGTEPRARSGRALDRRYPTSDG